MVNLVFKVKDGTLGPQEMESKLFRPLGMTCRVLSSIEIGWLYSYVFVGLDSIACAYYFIGESLHLKGWLGMHAVLLAVLLS